jgi:hypothetical protein
MCAAALTGNRALVAGNRGIALVDLGALPPQGSQAFLYRLRGVNARDLYLVPDESYVYVNLLLDVYEIVGAATAAEPDVEASVQRIRFSHEPGARTVVLTNAGAGTLILAAPTLSHVAFTTTFAGATLGPGESTTFEIRYCGASGAANDAGVVAFPSNDPDEDPLPIQVFGATRSLDPGELAVDFTLPCFRWDAATSSFVPGEFSLAAQRGKVVWFSIFATW